MANIRPFDLPPAPNVPSSAAFVIDTGAVVQKATAEQVVDSAIPLASQVAAETGSGNETRMSPLRVKQAIDAQALSQDFLAGPDGAEAVGFQWAEPNAVLRNLYDKAKDPGVSVKDFGALGNGSADDTLSISWANSVATLLGVPLFFPSGTYLTSANSQITTTWRGYGSVIKFIDNLSPGLIATASVASVLAEGVTIEGMTFDGNRANQTWDWVGSANYGLAVQAGGVTVMNCVTRNVTGNGTGVPTKSGSGRIAFINHRSYNNGKKGLHSGAVSGVDIIGGEWFDNENDSGIGIHQGGSDFNLTSPTCHSNGHTGIHLGHSNPGAAAQSHDIVVTGPITYGNATCGILVGSSQSPTHAERIFNVNIVGGIVRDKIVLQAATNVYITGTDLQGSNIEADNFSNLVIDGVKMLLPGTGVRIRCRRVGIGVDTEPTSNGLHIVNTVINTTGATSGITVSGTESGRIVNPMYVGSAPASYYLHVSDFTRDISIKTDYPVRLGSTNLTGVQDDGTQRIAYGAATPASGDWLVSDRLILPTATVDGNGMIQVGRICTVAGSPGTWVPQFISTVSPAT